MSAIPPVSWWPWLHNLLWPILRTALYIPPLIVTVLVVLISINVVVTYYLYRQKIHQSTSPKRRVTPGAALYPDVPCLRFIHDEPGWADEDEAVIPFTDGGIVPEPIPNDNPTSPGTDKSATQELNLQFNTLLDYAIRDFVRSWFHTISTDSRFPHSVRQEITEILRKVANRADRFDLPTLLSNRIIPIVTAHLHQFRLAERKARKVWQARGLPTTTGRQPESPAPAATAATNTSASTHTPSKHSMSAEGWSVPMEEKQAWDRLVLQHYLPSMLHRAIDPTAITAPAPPLESPVWPAATVSLGHLRQLTTQVLPLVCPPATLQSPLQAVFIREIITGAVLRPVCLTLCDPDTWNTQLDQFLTRAIEEQNMIAQLRQALNEQSQPVDLLSGRPVEGRHSNEAQRDPLVSPTLPAITAGSGITSVAAKLQGAASHALTNAAHSLPFAPRASLDGAPTYDQFIYSVKHCTDLGEIKQIRNQIVAQIRTKRILVEGKNKQEVVHGERVKDINVYINRLLIAKKLAEKQIMLLGREVYRKDRYSSYFMPNGPGPACLDTVKEDLAPVPGVRQPVGGRSRADSAPEVAVTDGTAYPYPHGPRFTFHEILTNHVALSYFTEYMDLIGKIINLQFWLTVEGLKRHPQSTNAQQLGTVLRAIYRTYFSADAVDELDISDDMAQDLRERFDQFNRNYMVDSADELGPDRSQELFELVIAAQYDVFQSMKQQYYPLFLRSGLYYRFLTANSNPEEQAPPSPSLAQSPVTISSHLLEPRGPTQRTRRSPSINSSLSARYGLTMGSQASRPPRDTDTIRTSSSRLAPSDILLGRSRGLPQPSDKSSAIAAVSTTTVSIHTSKSDVGSLGLAIHQSNPTRSPLVESQQLGTSLPSTLGKLPPIGPRPPPASSTATATTTIHHRVMVPVPTTEDPLLNPNRDPAQPNRCPSTSTQGTPPDTDTEYNPEPTEIPETDLLATDAVEAVEAALTSIVQGHSTAQVRPPLSRPNTEVILPTANGGDSEMGGGESSLLKLTGLNFANWWWPINPPATTTTSAVLAADANPSIISTTDTDTSTNVPKVTASPDVPVTTIEEKPNMLANLILSRLPYFPGMAKLVPEKLSGSTDSPDEAPTLSSKSTPTTESEVASPGPPSESSSDGDDDVESHHLSFQDNVHHAPPGDLLLSTKIAQIIQELDRKQQQSTIVTTLMSRAELLDKPNELRILKKSLSALQREIQLLTYQKQQYERQAEENVIVPGRTLIYIPGCTRGFSRPLAPAISEADCNQTKEGSSSVTHSVDLSSLPTPNPSPGPNPPTAHTLYLIEVQQMAPDGANDSGWVVSRRYREFSALHQQLKRRFAVVRNYDFPRKHQLPIIPALWSLTGGRRTQPWPPHVETRRIALEKYLQNITQHIEVCLSYELRQFLSQHQPDLDTHSPEPSASHWSASSQPTEPAKPPPAIARRGTVQFSSQAARGLNYTRSGHLLPSGTITPRGQSASAECTRQAPGKDAPRDLSPATPRTRSRAGSATRSDRRRLSTVSYGKTRLRSHTSPTQRSKRLPSQFAPGCQSPPRMVPGDPSPSDSRSATADRLQNLHAMTHRYAKPKPPLQVATGTSAIPRPINAQRDSPSVGSSPSLRPRLPVPRGGPLSPGTKRQSMGFLNPIQRTIADGLDDILGGPLMLDFISQQLGLQVADLTASEPHTTRGGAGGGALDIHQYLHESGSFIDPLCDLVIETFELKEKSNWLRKQAISILLRNVLGGTIERRIKDSLEALLSPGQLVQHLNTVLHTFWPANQPFTPPAPRSDARKFETQQQASQKWHFFVPNLVGSVVGQRNARRGATRLFNLIQNPYLNENLVCFILDEVVTQVFPEIRAATTASHPS
ncbi:tRNA (guanine-N(7)-)-methyltransferase (tRNA(m7G46)-methyltransferase) [Dimargaris cristalligena]|nr:tRNA (guanine-N(7)-)-methyltransferase (tRNA(m7G46)-methyltransferase) [Dimargaris cristalligena]